MVENRDFFIRLAFDAPITGSHSEYCHPVLYRKTSMEGLPDGKIILRIVSVVSTEYRRVQTDRQTDVQTERHLATA